MNHMSTAARPPSPTAPPLRRPSPLGRRSIIAQDDGTLVVADPAPARSSSVPPVQIPATTRPPSPGSASAPLRVPLQQATQTSRRELQKIDCQDLQLKLASVQREFAGLAKSLVKVQARISQYWSVPQRSVRGQMKTLVSSLVLNASYLAKYLTSISYAARKILNFVATCIRESHGLHDFHANQDLKPVLDELRLLQSHWQALEKAEAKYGALLSESTLVLEAAMNPDGWTPGTPLSQPTLELAACHHPLLTSFSSLSTFFSTLVLSTWKPPLLSPNDVKAAAASWREVETAGKKTSKQVAKVVREVVNKTVEMSFVSKDEGAAIWATFEGSSGTHKGRSGNAE
ncbi:hypothetical protein OF846_000892 [Rhodotorula toruloides]|nr:hypothetical protein OF846_000892 [Rhodotorula toruloides]